MLAHLVRRLPWIATAGIVLGSCASGVGTCCEEDADGSRSACVTRPYRSERAWYGRGQGHGCGATRVPAAWCPKGCAWTADPSGGPPACECSKGTGGRSLPKRQSQAPVVHEPAADPTTTLLCCSSGEAVEEGLQLYGCEVIDGAVPGTRTACVDSGKTFKECETAHCSGADCLCIVDDG